MLMTSWFSTDSFNFNFPCSNFNPLSPDQLNRRIQLLTRNRPKGKCLETYQIRSIDRSIQVRQSNQAPDMYAAATTTTLQFHRCSVFKPG